MLYTASHLAGLEASLRGLLPLWGLSPATRLSLLNISENTTFRADDPTRPDPIVLRVHRPGYHTRAEIASELDWIFALRAECVLDTPAILPLRSGKKIAAFTDTTGPRHVVAFAFAPGQEPSPDDDLVPGFRRLGVIAARLHAHARGWRRPDGFVRKRWGLARTIGPQAHWGRWQGAPALTPEGAAVLGRLAEALATRLGAWGDGPERFGLIHADLRLANLLATGDRLTVIDFDDCGFGWFLFDFAAAVSFIEDDPRLPAFATAWAEGYREVAPLSAADEAMLPVFVLLRRLQLTAWIATHAETPTARAMGPGFTATTVALADDWL